MKTVFRTRGDGRWFPADGDTLRAMTAAWLDAAPVGDSPPAPIVAGIAPHAGMTYSGAVAACTFQALRRASRDGSGPERVVILGFPHGAYFEGLAWLQADVIRTPAGDIPVDVKWMEETLAAVPGSGFATQRHMHEHSAENLLPFLQSALPDVPVAVGLLGGRYPDLRMALAGRLAADKGRTCLIASTDLLHDPDYDRVVASDARTLEMMEKLDSEALDKAWSYEHQVCCGIGPVRVALEMARALGCTRGRRLAYCNSGDVDPSGRGQWVVGYGSMVFETTRA